MNTCDSAKGYAYRGCDSCWVGFIIIITIISMWIVGVIVSQTSPFSRHLSLYRLVAQGKDACFRTSNINVGTSSCHGDSSCRFVSDSTIDNVSCHGDRAHAIRYKIVLSVVIRVLLTTLALLCQRLPFMTDPVTILILVAM